MADTDSVAKAVAKSLGLLALVALPLPYVGLLGDWTSFFCGVWAALVYRYYWRSMGELGRRTGQWYLNDQPLAASKQEGSDDA